MKSSFRKVAIVAIAALTMSINQIMNQSTIKSV
jgi:hypothetical protein